MPLKLVSQCRMGESVGNERKVLYTFMSDPKVTDAGTVKALVTEYFDADGNPGYVVGETEGKHEVRTREREWAHGHLAKVHVRPLVVTVSEMEALRGFRHGRPDPQAITGRVPGESA